MRVPFPFGVWGRMWNSIVSVPDYCLFIYFVFTETQNTMFMVILSVLCSTIGTSWGPSTPPGHKRVLDYWPPIIYIDMNDKKNESRQALLYFISSHCKKHDIKEVVSK